MSRESHYDNLLKGIDAERKAEEQYFLNLSGSKTFKERIKAGVLWYPVEITKQHYTIGEYVELELRPSTPSASIGSNNFKVGSTAQFFVNGNEMITFKGAISYANRNKVRVILQADVIARDHILKGGSLGVELMYDDRPYKVMADSIKAVQNSPDPRIVNIRELIANSEKVKVSRKQGSAPHIPEGLNDSQKKAIEGCHDAEEIAVIHGPPGTGKTTTLIGLVKGLSHYEKKILVVAPSNNAVDLLARLIHESEVKVLRVGNVTRIGDNISHLSLDEKVRLHKDWQHIKQVKIEAEAARKEASKYKRKFGASQRSNRGIMYKEAKQLKGWARELENKLVDKVIDEAQVVCCTLIGCASSAVQGIQFETVIIDESSQALEPESWTAILRGNRVIMAGDHKQLPPTVKSDDARRLGFEKTILDRISGHLDTSYLLDTQYRMHPSILAFSNSKFYGDNLITATQVLERESVFSDDAVTFIDTSGCGFDETVNPESKSKKNKQEFLMVREHIMSVQELLKDLTIGIISPYKEQVRLIRNEIEADKTLKAMDIEVNSIDGFQGQEKDVIYISLVRSNDRGEIGFLKDYRRLNVALTRAKQKLVIVGDMSTLSSDQIYLDLAEYVEKNGKYVSGWEYMG